MNMRNATPMTFTPEMAHKLVTDPKRVANRPISRVTVQAYATEMAAGNWKPDLNYIVLNKADGKLLDGQHRLSAVALLKEQFTFMVIKGSVDDLPAIDSGRARKYADVLFMRGDESNHALAAAKTTIVRGLTHLETGTTTKVTETIYQNALNVFGEKNITYMAELYKKSAMSAPAATALTFCRPINPELIERIIYEAILTTEPTNGINMAINRLRGRLNNLRIASRDCILYYLKGIKLVLEGVKDIERINTSKNAEDVFVWAVEERAKLGLNSFMFKEIK